MFRILLFSLFLSLASNVNGQNASVRINAEKRFQHITGFGGFVCSPQFGYNHMSQTDIKKVWGNGSTVGCNIMRLYIPIGRNAWSQSLQTAKQAKQLGLIVFASPWGQPAEWKTNGTINAKNSDGTTGKLKKENWPDYAQYLEDYVQYLRQNGVELDAISIQNEPDWPAEYAGCLWSASEIAEFVKTYGSEISCKVIAPETLGVSDSYANALNNSSVLPHFDIYGGHQYGGIQDGFKKLGQKGKELWMTEYLINWNENQSSNRNFDWNKDVFNFARSINTCMLNDFNAWIHYAAKRYYGMLGDGTNGTSTGAVTKRGYVMAHFARYVTGMTRIDATWNDEALQPLEGSAYLSVTGDTVAVVIFNAADASEPDRELTLDLPFYTQKGKVVSTTKSKNMRETVLDPIDETCRPCVSIPASSVSTVLFFRSRDRQPSQMTASTTRFDKIEDQTRTLSSYGSNYKLSGKTVKFDHTSPLLSNRTSASMGYLQLTDRFSRLVMHVNKVTSTLNYTSAKTTLYYVNNNGAVSSHDYGEMDLNRRENFNLVFDLSPATLKDGCRGLLSITNDNWSSVLTITFGDVYLANGSQYAATLTGAYVEDDSGVLDFTTDLSCTSLDMTGVENLPETLDWMKGNRVVYLSETSAVTGANLVRGNVCASLSLTADGGDFRPAMPFSADEASLVCEVDGCRMLMLPFEAEVPQGVKAYTIADDLSMQEVTHISAHQPVLVDGVGELTFRGTGEIAYATSPLTSVVRGVYTQSPLYEGDYILACQGDQWGLLRLDAMSILAPFDAYLTLSSTQPFIPLNFTPSAIVEVTTSTDTPTRVYNVMGQQVNTHHHGILIVNGKKYLK